MAVFKFLRSKQLVMKSAVLCYDGIMIPIASYKPSLLKQLSKAVEEETGFIVNFSTKDMKQGYENELKDVEDEESFEYKAKIFEQTHSLIVKKGLYVENDNESVHYFSPKQLVDSFKYVSYQKDGKKKNFINEWTTSNDNIKKYDDMDVYPAPLICPPNNFNMWTGFAGSRINAEPNKKGLQIFLNHLKIICNFNLAKPGAFNRL